MRQLLSLQGKLIKYDDMVSTSPKSEDAALLLLDWLIHARLVLAMMLVLARVPVLAGFVLVGLVLAGLSLAIVFVVEGVFLPLLAGTLAARAQLLGCCSELLLFGVHTAWEL